MDVDMCDDMQLLFEILEPIPQNPDFLVDGLEEWEEHLDVQPLENIEMLSAEWLLEPAGPSQEAVQAQATGPVDAAGPPSAAGQLQVMGAVQHEGPMFPAAAAFQAAGPALPAGEPEGEPSLETMGPLPKRPRLEDPLYDLGIDDVDMVVNPVKDIDNAPLMESVGNKIHRPKYYPKYREYLMNSRFVEKVRQCVLFYQTMGFIDPRAPPGTKIQEVIRIFEE